MPRKATPSGGTCHVSASAVFLMADDEVEISFLLDCQRERARPADGVGEGEDAVRERDAAIRTEREAGAQRVPG
jgi:hypothetical protein